MQKCLLKNGEKIWLRIRTVDTDVIVVLVSVFFNRQKIIILTHNSAFLSVMNQPFQFLKVDYTAMKLLERFTCILYDKTTPLVSVNELRQELFCKRAKMMENIPPTQVINISSILA